MLITKKAKFQNPQDPAFYSNGQFFHGQSAQSGTFVRLPYTPAGTWLRTKNEKEAAEYLHTSGLSWEEIAQESNYDPEFLDIVEENFRRTGARVYKKIIFDDFRGRRILKKHDFVKEQTSYFEEVNGTIKQKQDLT